MPKENQSNRKHFFLYPNRRYIRMAIPLLCRIRVFTFGKNLNSAFTGRMKKHILHRTLPLLMTLLFSLVRIESFSQFSYYDDERVFSIEFGIGGGLYYGDLTEKAISLQNAGFATSLGLSYSVTTQIRPMLTASFMKLGADDKNNSRQELIKRNLNFRSNVFDINLGLRYHFLSTNVSLISPYVYGGIGAFHFNPYTTDRTGIKRFLQTLGTEGQRLPNASQAPYKLMQFQFPFGAGLNYTLDRGFSVALDAMFRKTFTDYLDDVSTKYVDRNSLSQQNPILPSLAFRGDEVIPGAAYPSSTLPRGNPRKKDFYYTVGLKIMYQISY